MQEIIGYHGTKDASAKLILKDGFALATPKKGDNHWLGHGIYFYTEFELAEWWAKTKVKKQNKKYSKKDSPVVLKAVIHANNILDLDNPFCLMQFEEYQKKLEEQVINDGIVLDFADGKGQEKERIRCFWMDMVKEEYDIEVIIYTFNRKNPSYVNSKYHVDNESENSLKNMQLVYHEKQICVTSDNYIVEKEIVRDCVEEFDEVII